MTYFCKLQLLHYKCTYVLIYTAIQVIAPQETATGTQQDSDYDQTTANDAASEQQSSVQHQPTPQYALLDYKPTDKEVHKYLSMYMYACIR